MFIEIITNSEQIVNFLNPHYLRPWQNGQVAASWACVDTSLRWVAKQTRKSPRKYIMQVAFHNERTSLNLR